ncbi:putative membrane protein [Aeromonas phage ZPAH1]|nr:putative membrane protein [Aeromonas phage Aswh_1]QQG34101.1 putative membrane protein [Aeromonas phage ZPAH1]
MTAGYKVVAFLFLLSIVGGGGYYMFHRIEQQAITIGEMTQQIENYTTRITALETSISDFKTKSSEYNKETEKSNRELSVRLDKLDKNVQRGKDAIKAKPKLVEKLIQKDYMDFSQRMDCLTLEKCK